MSNKLKTRKNPRMGMSASNKNTRKKTYNAKPKLSNQVKVSRRRDKTIIFPDHPEFQPNLTPREMFALGSFGGTYWRPIYSSVVNKQLQNIHRKYPKSWWKGIPENWLSSPDYDKSINKYKVKVGTSLEFWEGKGWITKYNPYGWVQWYCDFYAGRRTPDDNRQIARWLSLAGNNGRFRNFIINLIKKKYPTNPVSGLSDYSISPKIRQVLQHWAYVLQPNDVK